MNPTFVAKWTAVMGAIASLMVFLLVGLAVATGVSQEYFEGFHPLAEYTEKLVKAAPLLRVGFAVDNVFLMSYATFFIGLAIILRRTADHSLVNLSLAAMLGVALLDMVENHHIMGMADIAAQGFPPSQGEVRWQMVLSLVKFHLSCLERLAARPRVPEEDVARTVDRGDAVCVRVLRRPDFDGPAAMARSARAYPHDLLCGQLSLGVVDAVGLPRMTGIAER